MARSLDFGAVLALAVCGRTRRRRSALPQHRQLRRLARGLQAGGGAQGISQRAISAALDGVTFDPAIIRRDSGQGVFQQSFLQFAGRMTGGGPLSERAEAVEGSRRAVVAHRASDRRAAAGGGRAVGSGKRLRRLQGRHLQHHPLGRDAGLRLPAPGVLPRPIDGRGAHRPARRSAAGPDDRQLGRRAWADAVHAVRTISSTASTSTATAAST